MGKFHVFIGYLVGLLCAASFAFSPVASAGTVSVDVSPTTGYSVTNRSTVALPPRTTSGPVANYNPTFGPLAGGGAYQTTSSGITITAVKDGVASSTTMSGRIRASAGAMKNGLSRCFTSFRCNIAVMVGAAGIEQLFDGIDWVMGEGGRVQRITKVDVSNSATPPYCTQIPRSNFPLGYRPVVKGVQVNSLCSIYETGEGPLPTDPSVTYFNNCTNKALGYNLGPTSSFPQQKCIIVNSFPPPSIEPLTPEQIKAGIDSNYTPDPSDLPFLSTGGLDFSGVGVDFEVLDIPSITGADNPTFIQNADGTSKGTFSQYDFSWSGPGKQPTVNVEEQTTETTYGPSGEVTNSSTTIVNGSGSSANNPPETPTDCDFMPTVCRFIDWFTEPDPETDQPVDFTELIDTVDIDKDFTVGSSTASCPAPFVVNLSWVPSVEVSLQPFCDLADLLRPLLLAVASLFSGMIILRT